MRKLTLAIITAAAALSLAGCAKNTSGLAGDIRLDAPIGSPDLRAACTARSQAGVLANTAIFFGNIAAGPIAGATAGTALANPLTQNYNARCAEQRSYDQKHTGASQ